MRFSQRLKLLRKNLHLNQNDLAEACNVQFTAISKYENELIKPSFEMLAKIGMAYNVNLNWLINEIGTMFLNKQETKLLKTGSDNTTLEIPASAQMVVSQDTHSITLENDIQVKYFSPDNDNFIKVFHPNGEVDYIHSDDANQNMQYLLQQLQEICTDENRFEFVMTAINALNDNEALRELKALVKGMELSRKI